MSATPLPPVLRSWFAPVSTLRQVGTATSDALQRLLRTRVPSPAGLPPPPTLRDLLFHLPTGISDRRAETAIAQLQAGQEAVVRASVIEHRPPPARRRQVPYRIAVADETGTLALTYYHVRGDYLSRQLPPGEVRLIAGRVEFFHGLATMAHPALVVPPHRAQEILRIWPLYPLGKGITQRALGASMRRALDAVAELPEWLDAAAAARHGWPGFKAALATLHQPQSPEDIAPEAPARSRLAYDELLANQVALALARRRREVQPVPAIEWDDAAESAWRAALPFSLTAAQEGVLQEMREDLRRGARMTRLLQGDVGSGKTLLAFALMVQIVRAGQQAALMAPTDLLARQHAASLAPLAKAAGLKLALLSGKMKKAEQAKVQAALRSGETQAVIGTHALFQQSVAFADLGLMVIDEQHRFGVAERLALAAKGRHPHLLQMSATPIPRSLTMTLYGDLDVSTLRELPPGRTPVTTRVMSSAREADVVAGLARVLARGERAYWVCPLIDPPTPQEEHDDPAQPLASVVARQEMLARVFAGRVGLMHGQMKPAERDQVMQRFISGELGILVATTVIEVGVNVPQATAMVIEQAERFGLAQLHQLRGRVGRSDLPSRCVLLHSGKLSALARERLQLLRDCHDGFWLAEEDLRLRGGGDLLGLRQTGLPDFLLAEMGAHLPLLRQAHSEAKLILHQDPDLTSPRGLALRLLLRLFDYDEALVTLRDI